MKILGISGFEGAIPFKRARWPQLDEREYRISQGHDSAAALVVDGAVVAAVAEERINRRKHTGAFPRGAIACCLAEAGVTIDQIDELAHGFDYAPYAAIYALDPGSHDLYRDVYSREALLALVARDFPDFPAERVHHVSHHLAHAASAYYTSGWDECLVVVIDGMGEAHSVSVYCARDGRLDLIFQVAAQDSIGILYSLVTLHLGFDFNADEYKIMGLAPYGDPERFRRFLRGGRAVIGRRHLHPPPAHESHAGGARALSGDAGVPDAAPAPAARSGAGNRRSAPRRRRGAAGLSRSDHAAPVQPLRGRHGAAATDADRGRGAELHGQREAPVLGRVRRLVRAAGGGRRRQRAGTGASPRRAGRRSPQRALVGALPRTRAHAGGDRRGPRRVRRPNPGHSLRHPRP